MQVGHKVDQLIQLNVVINVFFPLQQEFIQRNAALTQSKFGQAVFRFGLEAQVFQRHIAFVGQFDLQRRRKVIVAIAFEALAVIGIAAKAFPVELDTGKLFIIEGGNIEAEFAVAGKVNRIGHGQRRLLAEEAV